MLLWHCNAGVFGDMARHVRAVFVLFSQMVVGTSHAMSPEMVRSDIMVF